MPQGISICVEAATQRTDFSGLSDIRPVHSLCGIWEIYVRYCIAGIQLGSKALDTRISLKTTESLGSFFRVVGPFDSLCNTPPECLRLFGMIFCSSGMPYAAVRNIIE